MDAESLIKLYKAEVGSSERGNFNTLYETCAEWCNPSANDIQSIRTAGEQKTSARLIDVGIRARRIFTAGMMSHLFPQGQNWIRVTIEDRELLEKDSVVRALSSATKKFIARINESNFEEEMGQCIDHCGYIGTTAIYCEKTDKKLLNWRSHYINSFCFQESYEGDVDVFIRNFELTARQAVQQFGDDVPKEAKTKNSDAATAEDKFKFIHVVLPRTKGFVHGSARKKELPIASYYVCMDTKEIVKESGYDEMPYSVARFYKTNYEKYGRSPALDVYSTLPMINRMELTRIRAAERVSSPPWLSPNDGSVRRISNDQGSIIHWNAGNPLSKPEQLRVSDNVMVNDEMIVKKEQEVLEAFFAHLFNPLKDKKNMTAFESSERLNLSLQFLVPAINRLDRQFIRPALERAFNILLRQGEFPELQIDELSGKKISFELIGKAFLASRQLELYGTMTALEQTGIIGQVKPEVWDNWNIDKTARSIQEGNMVPVALQASEDEIASIREVRAKKEQAQAAQDASAVGADAYAKTTKVPESGSGAEKLVEAM